jgi:hypothetical protein
MVWEIELQKISSNPYVADLRKTENGSIAMSFSGVSNNLIFHICVKTIM